MALNVGRLIVEKLEKNPSTRVGFPLTGQGRHSQTKTFGSQWLAWTHHYQHFTRCPHENWCMSRGQTGFTTPCLYGSFIRNSHPVFTGAPCPNFSSRKTSPSHIVSFVKWFWRCWRNKNLLHSFTCVREKKHPPEQPSDAASARNSDCQKTPGLEK